MANKILHVFPYTIFAINYVGGFSTDTKRSHLFYLYGSRAVSGMGGFDNNSTPDIYIEEDDDCYVRLRELVKTCDLVVINCLPEGVRLASQLVEAIKRYEKEFVISPWGREILKTSDLYRHQDKRLIKVVDETKDFFVKNCKAVIMSEYAYRHVNNLYGVADEKKRFFFNNIRVVSEGEILELQGGIKTHTKNGFSTVMVGHRGTDTSCHIEGFEYLKEFRSNFRLFCPLSIGDTRYIEGLITKGRELFGNSFIYLREWMNKTDYYSLLRDTVDVALFLTNTSEALVTCLLLLAMGIKVYARADVLAYYTEAGFVIHPFELGISETEFFEEEKQENRRRNMRCAKDYCSDKGFINGWSRVFEYCLR